MTADPSSSPNREELPEGFLYVAMGLPFVREAMQSAESLKKVDDQAHITLVTDVPPPASHPFDIVIERPLTFEPHPKVGYLYKINGMRQTPYRKTIYLDTDTYVCEEFRELFAMLDYFDLCLAHSSVDSDPISLGGGPELKGYFAYNTGVVGYKDSSGCRELLEKWERAYQSKIDSLRHDQPAFMEALLTSPVKSYVLQGIYNARLPYFVNLIAKPAKILHGRGYSSFFDFEKVEQRVNSKTCYRIWNPGKRRAQIFQEPLVRRVYFRIPPKYRDMAKRIFMKIRGQ